MKFIKPLLFVVGITALFSMPSCQKVSKGFAYFTVSQEHSCGEIEVQIGDITGMITEVHPYVDCSYTDALKFELVEGTYGYRAWNQCDEWTGVVTVKGDQCSFKEIVEE